MPTYLSTRNYADVEITAKPYHFWSTWRILKKFHYFPTGGRIRFYVTTEKETRVDVFRKGVGNNEFGDAIWMGVIKPGQKKLIEDRVHVTSEVQYFAELPITGHDRTVISPILTFAVKPHEDYNLRQVGVMMAILGTLLGAIVTWILSNMDWIAERFSRIFGD